MKLEARSLVKRYGVHSALDGASFTVPADTGCLVMIGASGSGKSTLLRVLGSLLTPDSGQVLVQDLSIYRQPFPGTGTIRGIVRRGDTNAPVPGCRSDPPARMSLPCSVKDKSFERSG